MSKKICFWCACRYMYVFCKPILLLWWRMWR